MTTEPFPVPPPVCSNPSAHAINQIMVQISPDHYVCPSCGCTSTWDAPVTLPRVVVCQWCGRSEVPLVEDGVLATHLPVHGEPGRVCPGSGHKPEEDVLTALDPQTELREWWITTAESDIASFADKIREYGGESGPAQDLIDIGRAMACVSGRKVSDEEATELGIFFYVVGKLGRWTSAVSRGERPSADTLLDMSFYLKMARRNRMAGGWPWGPVEEPGDPHADLRRS